MIVFGPIPSRRLGRSLGINNIPPKVCSYSCVYCQLGTTGTMSIERKNFFSPDVVFDEVSQRLELLHRTGEPIDYVTFVPDGEPTLDINLGETLSRLNSTGVRRAVITNASLLGIKEVRRELSEADWVSVKIDSADERIWKRLNRPHGKLSLEAIREGVLEFSASYHGTLVTETMLVRGINDGTASLFTTAGFISEMNPRKAYIMAPTRPPAETFVTASTEETMNAAYQIYRSVIDDVELLTHSEGVDFTFSSDAEEELLGITAVHPMREEAVGRFLEESNSDWDLVDRLIANNQIRRVEYLGETFFIRRAGSRVMNN